MQEGSIRDDDIQLEHVTARQRLAPEELVVRPERRTVLVGVLSYARLGPEVERGIESPELSHPTGPTPDAASTQVFIVLRILPQALDARLMSRGLMHPTTVARLVQRESK